MNFKKWKPYIFWILLAEGVGLLAGLLTRDATAIYATTINKPPLSPPGIVFPIVWTILYALMGIGAASVATSPKGKGNDIALNLFVIQLVVNFFWSFFFFNAQAFGLAGIALGAGATDDYCVLACGSAGCLAANSILNLADICGVFEFCGIFIELKPFLFLQRCAILKQRKE